MNRHRSGVPLRVLLIAAATSTTGGGERHIADLLEALPARGLEVALACPAGGDLATLARAADVPVFEAPIAAGFSPAKVHAMRAAIVAWAPHVVHAHGSRAAAFARLADPQAGRRVVYHVHGIHVDRAGSARRRIALLNLERLLRPRTAAFVTVCHADAQRGERLGVLTASRTATVYNGIDVPPPAAPKGRFRAELGAARESPLVVSIGRFHAQKGQASLLEAWRRVVRVHPEALLALVGSGGLEGSLRAQVVATGIANNVRFVAPRRELAEAYVDADVFALSSRWEGLPYVLLEAMAYGLAVASTAVDGVPEAVSDGQTGILVPADDPPALGRALAELLADPKRRRRLGDAARVHVADRFTLERMIDGITAVYHAVARGALKQARL